MAKTVQIDVARLNRAIAAGLNKTTQQLAKETQRQIKAKKWGWPRRTQRANGRVAGTTRNIRDLDELLDSMDVLVLDDQGQITYQAAHSLVVHEGRADIPNYPGRPYGTAAIAALDLPTLLETNIRRALR